MGVEMPAVPVGSGKHPVLLVVISANELAASTAFYSRLFGWQAQPLSAELTAIVPPGGPTIALRGNIPAGFPGLVPYIGVVDVKAGLAAAVAAGGSIEREPWSVPMVGMLARYRDPSGTIYGVTDTMTPGAVPRIPMPFGPNPKPVIGSICSLEMFGADQAVTAKFFGDLYGWGSAVTMPQFLAFDPGAGIGGVFQSHTPSLPAVAYIYVQDVRATLDAIDGAGGKRSADAMAVPGMACFGYFTDPSGTHMGLIGE
ncbi:MAG: VOC family protein [Gemmatimonadota bacterium]